MPTIRKKFVIPSIRKLLEDVEGERRVWNKTYEFNKFKVDSVTSFKPRKIPYKKLGIKEKDHLLFVCGGLGGFARKAAEDGHYVEYVDVSEKVVDFLRKKIKKSREKILTRVQPTEELSARSLAKPPIVIGMEPYPLMLEPENAFLFLLRTFANGRGGLLIERDRIGDYFKEFLSKLKRRYGFELEEGKTRLLDENGQAITLAYLKIMPERKARIKAFHDLQVIYTLDNMEKDVSLKKLIESSGLQKKDVIASLKRIDHAMAVGKKAIGKPVKVRTILLKRRGV